MMELVEHIPWLHQRFEAKRGRVGRREEEDDAKHANEKHTNENLRHEQAQPKKYGRAQAQDRRRADELTPWSRRRAGNGLKPVTIERSEGDRSDGGVGKRPAQPMFERRAGRGLEPVETMGASGRLKPFERRRRRAESSSLEMASGRARA